MKKIQIFKIVKKKKIKNFLYLICPIKFDTKFDIQRVFLLGCPRSGTTIFQSFLSAHSRIHSFPETHFFEEMSKELKKNRIDSFLDSIKKKEQFSRLAENSSSRKGIQQFINLLDKETLSNNKNYWLEKTPGHLFTIDRIKAVLPNAKVIHLIRRGEDVVASLYDFAHKYSSDWGARYKDIDYCVNFWNRCIDHHIKYKHMNNHLFVSYEKLIDNSNNELHRVCNFLDLSYEKNMLENYKVATKNIININEPWKNGVGKDIHRIDKFSNLFSKKIQNYICDNLNYKQYHNLLKNE